MRSLFPGLYYEGPRSVKINDCPDVLCCCSCAKMSAQLTAGLSGPDGLKVPTPDPQNRDRVGGEIGALGRRPWQLHTSEFLFFFFSVLQTQGPITHAGQEDAGRVWCLERLVTGLKAVGAGGSQTFLSRPPLALRRTGLAGAQTLLAHLSPLFIYIKRFLFFFLLFLSPCQAAAFMLTVNLSGSRCSAAMSAAKALCYDK